MVICPVCGREGYLEARKTKSNTYYFVVHEEWRNGKRVSRVKHYIGPKDYKYVSKTHEFTLHGQFVKGRELKYLSTIATLLIESGNIEELEKMLPELMEMKREIDALITHITAAINVAKNPSKLTSAEELSLENFAKHLKAKGYAQSTIRKKLAIIKKFLASLDVPLPRVGRNHVASFLLDVSNANREYAKRTLREFLDYIGLKELASLIS